MWTAFLHDIWGVPKAVRRYTIIFIEVIWITSNNIPRLDWGWVHYFSDPACVFLISIKLCCEVHIENYLPLDQKPIRAIRMRSSYWKVPFSCCENLNVRFFKKIRENRLHLPMKMICRIIKTSKIKIFMKNGLEFQFQKVPFQWKS